MEAIVSTADVSVEMIQEFGAADSTNRRAGSPVWNERTE
jgi:hypothetical protein